MNAVIQGIREKRRRSTPKKVKRTNKGRVALAELALVCGAEVNVDEMGNPENMKDAVIDVFANICHLCHRDGIDAREAFETAWRHYEAEA